MNGLCKEGKVRELFHRMVHKGLSPNTMSYNTIVLSNHVQCT